jgi:hypothetical protein
MARPRINDNDKRSNQMNIRLTDEENAKAISYAQASGMSPANWIRKIVFTGKFPPLKLSPVDASLYRELKKIGVNLNQVTHRINQGVLPNEYLACQTQLVIILNRILTTLTDDGKPDQG